MWILSFHGNTKLTPESLYFLDVTERLSDTLVRNCVTDTIVGSYEWQASKKEILF